LGAGPEPLRIAVLDLHRTGGAGAGVDGLVLGLKKHGYQVDAIADLNLLTLLQYDVLYLSDMHKPGRVRSDWRETVMAFVEGGGSVLQTWHHHFLGKVGVGVLRIYGRRRLHVRTGHPAVAGVSDFDASFKDHIIERVGPAGTVLLTNDAGQPVAAAGAIGKGKVISTGLALAIPDGRRTRPPEGEELKLLKAFLAWLVPEIPRDSRLAAALAAPRLETTPTEVLVAAGRPAVFRVQVAAPDARLVQVTCEGGKVTGEPPAPAPGGGPPRIARFEIVAPTERDRAAERELTVQAKAGETLLEEKIKVSSVYAPAPPNEKRGVWLHVGLDRHPKTVMPELRELGINMAVPRIAGGTAAFYASKVQADVQDPLAAEGGDWLAETVKHAHANGIEIHPYVNNCVVRGRSSKESLQRLRDAGRLQQGPKGEPIDWFCPSQDANFDVMEGVMLEIATRYDVDGVQYDFIRYPNSQGCFCPKCRARFEKETGAPAARWPDDVIDGPRKAEWTEFRCGRISALVQRISTRIRKEAPKVKISAAVFHAWPRCREDVGQDWVRWCREGWLDFVCPMNYTHDQQLFVEHAETHRQALPEGFPVLQGIGFAAGNGSMTDPSHAATHIALARRVGVRGFVGFCYRPQHTTALLGPLRDWLRAE